VRVRPRIIARRYSYSLPIREVEVSMASHQDIAAQIRNCSEDVIALIRGGGDIADFAVFETPIVLEALDDRQGWIEGSLMPETRTIQGL
jgi:hypothetical protein